MLNKAVLMILISIFAVSCSTFSVDTKLDNVSNIQNPKKIGVIVRTYTKSKVSREDFIKNLSGWLNGFKHNTRLDLVTEPGGYFLEYNSDDERVYQVSDSGDYLKYKSIGLIKTFVRNNRDKLETIVSTNKYDALLVYEIHGIYSSELQLMIYNSTITMLDKKFDPIYLDYQRDSQELAQYSPNAISKEMMDRMSIRFLKKMNDFGYVEEM